MTPDDIAFTVSLPVFAGLVVLVLLPSLLWATTIMRMMKELLDMHRDPEQSQANQSMQELVSELHQTTAELHANNAHVISDNTRAINQLSYLVKWLAGTQGQNIPPYVEDRG